MMMRPRPWTLLATGLTLIAVTSQPVLACAVCFGDPDSDMVKGAKAGVLVLAVIVYGVVFSMAGVAGFWILKSRRIAAANQDQSADPAADSDDS